MSHYFGKRSQQNVVSHLRQLSLFCVTFHASFLPVSRDTLLGFIELMSRTSGFEHIQHIMSSIRFIHQYTGHHFPVFNTDIVDTGHLSLVYNPDIIDNGQQLPVYNTYIVILDIT